MKEMSQVLLYAEFELDIGKKIFLLYFELG